MPSGVDLTGKAFVDVIIVLFLSEEKLRKHVFSIHLYIILEFLQ